MQVAPAQALAVPVGIEEEMVELIQPSARDQEVETQEFTEAALRLEALEILCLTIPTKRRRAWFTGTSIYYLSSAVRAVAAVAVLDKEQTEMLAVGAERF